MGHSAAKANDGINWGELYVDPLVARWGDEELPLTRTERLLLIELVRAAPQQVDRLALCSRVFGTVTGPQRVDVHVSHLRTKLSATTLRIPMTKRGSGYEIRMATRRILIADDNARVATAVAKGLEVRLNAQPVITASADECETALQRHWWDGVVLDVLFATPRQPTRPHGLWLADFALRRCGIETVVLMSGDPAFAADAFGLNLPFLLKPFALDTLSRLLLRTQPPSRSPAGPTAA